MKVFVSKFWNETHLPSGQKYWVRFTRRPFHLDCGVGFMRLWVFCFTWKPR